MWAQSFDCHVEVTWIGQSFTENGDSFATITNIWEAKKMWLLCRMSWWLAFSLFFPRFKLPSQASSSFKNFSGILLTLNGLRDSGSMLCRLHRQTKKSVHDTGSFIHKEHQASGGSLKSCRRYVSVQSKRVDRRSCMFFLVYGRSRTNSRGLTWPHLRNLFLKFYVKITSKTSNKATNQLEELRLTVIKIDPLIN